MIHNDNRVYLDLRERVAKFEFAPGSQLNITRLSSELQTSSIPTREALIRLAEQDLIDCISGKGFFSKMINEEVFLNELKVLKLLFLNNAKINIEINKNHESVKYIDNKLKSIEINNCTDCFVFTKNNEKVLTRMLFSKKTMYSNVLIENYLVKTHYIRALIAEGFDSREKIYSSILEISDNFAKNNLPGVEGSIINLHGILESQITETVNQAIVRLHNRFSYA